MSSSTGTHSNKISWYKKMCAKIEHEEAVKGELKKYKNDKSYKSKVQLNKNNKKLFEE